MQQEKSESEKIKQVILQQLEYGAACHIHPHRECCRVFGLEEPCKNRTEDSRFDKPWKKLLEDGLIRKIRAKTIHIGGEKIERDKTETVEQVGHYAFYELTQKGKQALQKG